MAKTDRSEIPHDDALEAFFNAARQDNPAPSDALMSAILADADRLQPQPKKLERDAEMPVKQGAVKAILSAIGGWPSAAGMVTATVAGVWIGFAQPVQLELLSGGLVLSGTYSEDQTDYSLEDLAPSYLDTSLFAEDEG
ncbi:hypothetical protein [Aliiroseovarius marinus]|uniref:hypothetical protein n=1 Tax=Aliiroseovarius marinus TaxID=2500159 RepID=UPI003D7C6C09